MSTDKLDAVLGNTGPVLLDFDGPVTILLPSGPNAEVAEAARQPLRAAGAELPEPVASTSDHLAVLRFASCFPPEVELAVEEACRAGEFRAALASDPTPGSVDFLGACIAARRPVVVASNNAAEPVAAYLNRHGLGDQVLGVVGRRAGRPDLMKPHPSILLDALRMLDVDHAGSCVMIGDTVSDVQASQAAGVRIVGYAKTPDRGRALAEAGADAVVDSMTTLAAAVRRAAHLPS
jgi:beta-phosphoglucomutase-like phosphatase (HAD superfamily)